MASLLSSVVVESDLFTREFAIPCGDSKLIIGHVIAMNNSAYIWLNDPENGEYSMNNLIISMNTKFESMPLATSLLSDFDDDYIQAMNIRLTKKHNIQLYISSNVNFDVLNAQVQNAGIEIEASLSRLLGQSLQANVTTSTISIEQAQAEK